MTAADQATNCSGLPSADRCAAALPDNPRCAPNYHFGMLLGVEDLQAEQGFHVGRLRRHQRLLHGAGVVAGFPIGYDAPSHELKVGPGYGIDRLGRDLLLDRDQCVNLALWWAAHREEPAFQDIEPGVTAFDLDIVACYQTCLDRPVPAIADPCAGDAADIAYSRICESVLLALVRHDPEAPVQATRDYHLLRVWLGLEAPARDAEGALRPEDQWLVDALATLAELPADQQTDARQALGQEVLARAVAAISPFPPDADDQAKKDQTDSCLLIARLSGVIVTGDGAGGWTIAVETVDRGAGARLLPSGLLQDLLLATPAPAPPPAGPVVMSDGATIAGDTVTLVFDQPLAPATVTAEAFAISELDPAEGWQAFMLGAVSYDEADPAAPTVTVPLDRTPAGLRLRITIIGTGNSPLMGANLIPAGALDANGDGRNLTTTLVL
jgi:hypothetical protein